MPTYEFRNKQTGDVTEHIMRISERDQFILENPQLEQTITVAPAFAGDHISVKRDTGFKEVLQKGVEHCLRGDVFQIVPSRRFAQKFEGDDFQVYRALRSVNPSPRRRGAVLCACHWAACGMRRRFAAIAGPISAPCRARSFRG